MEKYFKIALNEAKKANFNDDIPVGAVIIKNNKIIAKAHNNRHVKNNVIGHAEILAILKAQKNIKDWRLYDCDMYITLKPCKMCEAVIMESRLSNIYYLVDKTEEKNNYQKISFNFVDGILSTDTNEYKQRLVEFFKDKRI